MTYPDIDNIFEIDNILLSGLTFENKPNFINYSFDNSKSNFEKYKFSNPNFNNTENVSISNQKELVKSDFSEPTSLKFDAQINDSIPTDISTKQQSSVKYTQINPNIKFNGNAINVDDVINTLHTLLKTPIRHMCTRHVTLALSGIDNINTSSGVKNPEVLYQKLLKDGWKDVYTSNYIPQKGDVYTIWNVKKSDGTHMHSSMYDGEKWISYGVEGKNNPWLYSDRNQKGVKIHIMRYPNLISNEKQFVLSNQSYSKSPYVNLSYDPNYYIGNPNNTSVNASSSVSKDYFMINQQLEGFLINKNGQYYASKSGDPNGNQVVGPFGCAYKYIDEKGNPLKNPVKFTEGEIVNKDFAIANAQYNMKSSAQKIINRLGPKGGLTQDKLDAICSFMQGTKSREDNILNYLDQNWGDWNKISSYIRTNGWTGNGKYYSGLMLRRQLEADWFMGRKYSFKWYQNNLNYFNNLYSDKINNK